MIRRIILPSLLGTALVIGVFLYLQPKPCAAPLPYRIGTIDPRFEVSRETFAKDIVQASAIWEKSFGKPLFVYDPAGALEINLIYDNRQAITQKEQVLHQDIDTTSAAADSVKQQFIALKADYEQEQQEYLTQVTQFNAAQARYNAEVAEWNSRGGAPKAEYEKLSAEKNALNAEQNALEAKRLAVNELADSVNAFIKKYNLLVSSINKNVSAINNDGLAGTRFEEGLYVSDKEGTRINIYQFGNKTDLVRVIAHELGHSLGLGHVADQGSIMSPVNQSDSLATSPLDLAALNTLCGQN